MKTIVVIGVASVISACGMVAMPSKVDKTNSGVSDMDRKMDHTNDGLDKVDTSVKHTNDGLDQANTKLDHTNASIDQLNGKVDQTNAGLNQTNAAIQTTNAEVAATNAAIHSQILLLSLQELTKPENTMVLTPPIGMMPAGEKFAAEATDEEVLELAHAWLIEYDTANLDVANLKSTGYSDADIAKMQADFKHRLDAKFVGLQIIAGMLPEATVTKVAEHITGNGAFRSEGLAVLMLREYFVETFLLQLDLLRGKLELYGQMQRAVALVQNIDHLGRLPFAASIGFSTKKTGAVKFGAKSTLIDLYQDLDHRFDSDLDPMYQNPVTPELKKQSDELASMRQTVRDGLAYWQGRP